MQRNWNGSLVYDTYEIIVHNGMWLNSELTVLMDLEYNGYTIQILYTFNMWMNYRRVYPDKIWNIMRYTYILILL